MSVFVAKPPISGLSNIYKSLFFKKNEPFQFYKVFTKIGSLGFTNLVEPIRKSTFLNKVLCIVVYQVKVN